MTPSPGAEHKGVEAETAPLNVILVDDDPTIRLIVEMALGSSERFSVTTIDDPRIAIARARQVEPDVILLDHQMEGMDGTELLLHFQATADLASIPVIFLTGQTQDTDRFRALGAIGVISKPFNPERLADDILEILEEQAAAASEADATPGLIEQLRIDFLRQGKEESAALLEQLSRVGEGSSEEAEATLRELGKKAHLWIGRGGTLGYPAITTRARQIETLIAGPSAVQHVEEASLLVLRMTGLFDACTVVGDPVEASADEGTSTDRLPAEVVQGLRGKRVGMVGFDTAKQEWLHEAFSGVDAFTRPIDWEQAGDQGELELVDLILVHTPGIPTDDSTLASLHDTTVPLLLVGERRSMPEWLSCGQRRDFVLSTQDPAEYLLRGYRLLSAPPPAPTGLTSTTAKGNGIVMADDDPTISSLVAATLRSQDVPSRIATSGTEALELIAQERPAVVLLDINMPGLDGFEVLTAIRGSRDTADLPVVLLTARQQETDVLRAFALGADDYVVKPFNPIELVARLMRLMRS